MNTTRAMGVAGAILVAALAGAAAPAAVTRPEAKGYDLILSALVASHAPISFDDPGTSFGWTASGHISEGWVGWVVFPNAVDAKGRLRHAMSRSVPFTPRSAREERDYAHGSVEGSWSGQDYRAQSGHRTPSYPYTCKYGADAATIRGARVVWNLYPSKTGRLSFGVVAYTSPDTTEVHCQGGDPDAVPSEDYPGPRGWGIGTLEPEQGLAASLPLSKRVHSAHSHLNVDLQKRCGGPCSGPELLTAATVATLTVRMQARK